jgi:ATP phosphoribosyltransferase
MLGIETVSEPLVIAVPKGRILKELQPLLERAGIVPEPAFFDEDARQLQFATNRADVSLVRVRSFDVATFVAFGAAQLGVAGSDVLMEFDYPELFSPIDLRIGTCRLSVAAPKDLLEREDPASWSHVRVATKYPNVTRRHFASKGIQAECIKLNGAMELAPQLGLCRRIVDLVSTGSTLRANGLVELDVITQVSSRLIVNRTALKTRPDIMAEMIGRFGELRDAA